MRKLPGHAHAEIRAAVSLERVNLAPARNLKALVRHGYGFRLRVGNYRVFFVFDGVVPVLGIEEVKRRDERRY